jgi:hypothetical protein
MLRGRSRCAQIMLWQQGLSKGSWAPLSVGRTPAGPVWQPLLRVQLAAALQGAFCLLLSASGLGELWAWECSLASMLRSLLAQGQAVGPPQSLRFHYAGTWGVLVPTLCAAALPFWAITREGHTLWTCGRASGRTRVRPSTTGRSTRSTSSRRQSRQAADTRSAASCCGKLAGGHMSRLLHASCHESALARVFTSAQSFVCVLTNQPCASGCRKLPHASCLPT